MFDKGRRLLQGTMKHRSGPSSTAQTRASKVHPVEKSAFLHPMALVAPPMIFQKRVQAVERCGFTYSDTWVRQQHEASIATQCAGSRVCEEDLLVYPRNPNPTPNPNPVPPRKRSFAAAILKGP